MKRHIRRSRPAERGAWLKYCALFAAFALSNFALPFREPLAFPLFYAALGCGFDPLLAGAGYLAASAAALDGFATLSAAIQAAFLIFVFALYRRFSRTMRLERLLYLALAQLPFVFLFPHGGYALLPISPIFQKLILSCLIFLLSAFYESGLDTLLRRAFRCRLTTGQFAELILLWLVPGLGIVGAFGETAFLCLALSALLVSVLLLSNASSLPVAVVLSLPLCLFQGAVLPLALFTVYACAALLFSVYGRFSVLFGFVLAYAAATFFTGGFFGTATEIVLALLPGFVAAAVALCLPDRLLRRFKKGLLFYRERSLPRIAINRNRRAVGERLYEVSSLFREIESAFSEELPAADASSQIYGKLRSTLCTDCPGRRRCDRQNVQMGLEKLIAVGYVKGQVSLVDLPESLSTVCGNTAGLLFACNRLLASYRAQARELENAREGRKLLAEQAHGVSELLKDLALEQSEEYSFSEGEAALSRALATAGILSSEIFVYGGGETLTVSMTLTPDVNEARLCRVAGEALGVPLALSDKIPLSPLRACYLLKRKPSFDASFGVASVTKEGETACGDAYSVLKIDERRFLVALSDGMGSGENARGVSDKTLSLLESFYKARMPSETVLSTVNRLIAFSPEETFSCLDLAAVDLDTGEADVVKIGSPVGFILSDEELRVLEGGSLPMGMLDAVHPATLRAQMHENDFMLFMSDGVTSAFGSSSDLYDYLSGLRPINPQSLAEEILNKAMGIKKTAEDDMTVLAVKLTKN